MQEICDVFGFSFFGDASKPCHLPLPDVLIRATQQEQDFILEKEEKDYP